MTWEDEFWKEVDRKPWPEQDKGDKERLGEYERAAFAQRNPPRQPPFRLTKDG